MTALTPEPVIPPVLISDVAPATGAVAALERSRLVLDGGVDCDDFSADTNPTDSQVRDLIDQAGGLILGQLPPTMDPTWFPRVTDLVTLMAAILVEGSVFREQLDQGAVALYRSLLTDGLEALQGALGWTAGMGTGTGTGAGGAQTITSIRMKSVMADYDPFYETYRTIGIY